MKIFYQISFLLLSFASLQAEDMNVIYNKANAAYQKGDYETAIIGYLKILDSGRESAEVFYNLGNAYYKSGEVAPAILYYERAARINSSDEDIRFNLRMANLKVIDKISPIPEFELKKWWNELILLFGANTWAALSLGLAAGLFFCLAMFRMSGTASGKRILFSLSVIFFISSATAFTLARSAKEKLTKEHFAILFSASAYVKSSPEDKSTDLFILHEGTKVRILDQIGGWKRIRIADGNEGWIAEKDIKLI